MCAYADSQAGRDLRAACAKAGNRLDMGNSSLRLRSLGEILPDALAPLPKATSVESCIAKHEALHRLR
jgi:hypothetical protein